MPELMVLSCPVCGASLAPDSERCSYCGSYIFIKTDLPKLDRGSLNQAVIQDHIITFRQRVRSNNFDEEAHYGLAMAYYSLGLLDEAIEELTEAARQMPENPNIQAQLAIALYGAFQAGNAAVESQMNSRIQRAILLDPDHVEARVLKAEVLIHQSRYSTAIRELSDLKPDAQGRVRSRIVSALETTFEQRLNNRKWDGAQWCWVTIHPIDAEAAKQMALRFLRLHHSTLPKTIMFAPKPNATTGGILGWRGRKQQPDSSHSTVKAQTRYSREELLWGRAQSDQTIEAANSTLERVKFRESIGRLT